MQPSPQYNFRTFSSPQKETSYPLTVSPHPSLSHPTRPWQPLIRFLSLWTCLFWTSRIDGILPCVWSFASNFCRFARCFQGSSMLWPSGLHSFLLLSNILLYGYTAFYLPIRHAGEHLNRFHFVALTKNAAVNICSKFLRGNIPSFLSGTYPRVELLGHTVTLHLTFRGTTRLCPKAAAPFLLPASSIWRVTISPHPHQHLVLPVSWLEPS